MFPVYVPSMGRPRNKTCDGLMRDGVEFIIAVEPDEADQYAANYGAERLLVMKKKRAGEAFARNSIKFHALRARAKFHFQIDDDISSFRIGTVRGKSEKVKFGFALELLESEAMKVPNLGVASGTTAAFPYGGQGSLLNNKIQSALLVNTVMPISFRHVPIFGPLDLDLALQCLHAKMRTLLCTQVRYYGPVQTGMTMQGGCAFTPQTRNDSYRRLAAAWPQYINWDETRPSKCIGSAWKHFREKQLQEKLFPKEIK